MERTTANAYLIGLAFLLQVIVMFAVSWYALDVEERINELETRFEDEHILIQELTVYDLRIDVEEMTVHQVRTATNYPLGPVLWEARLVDEFTGEIICQGSGSSTIEEREDNTVVLSLPVWVGSMDCGDLSGRTIAPIGQWTWSDHHGRARVVSHHGDPVTIPE